MQSCDASKPRYITLSEKALFFGLLLFVVFLASGYTTAILYNGLLISIIAWGVKSALQIRHRLSVGTYGRKPTWRLVSLESLTLIFLSFALASSLFSPDPRLSFKSFWKLAQGAIILMLVSNGLTRMLEVKRLTQAMLVSGSLTAAVSLLFYAFNYQLSYDGRLLGTFKHQNDLAAYLMLSLPLLAGILVGLYKYEPKVDPKSRLKLSGLYTLWLGLLLMISCLVFTFTRGAWISVFVAFCALTLSFEKRVALAMAALILTLSLIAPLQVKDRFLSMVHHKSGFMGERLYWWEAAAKMISSRPLFGVGAGRFKEEYPLFKPSKSIDFPDHAHNVYLHVASEYGIFALLALLSILAVSIKYIMQVLHNSNSGFDLGLIMGIYAALISWCVYGLIDNSLHRRTALFFWFILGLLSAVRKMGNRKEKLDAKIV